MAATIHPIHLGIYQVYIIRDEGTVMVDGGIPGKFILIAKNSVRNTTTAPSNISRDGWTMGRLGGEMSLPSKSSGSRPYRWKS